MLAASWAVNDGLGPTMNLLERDDSLAELEAALREAAAGNGRIILVCGEAGIGKTSLIEQFTRQQQDARVLWGACDSLFTPRPLGPLHDMAAQMTGSVPTLLTADGNRSAIFSALLADWQQQSTIAVFEDIHWADEATLDLLKYLGRRMQRTRSLCVVTYRDDELGPQHPLRLVLGDLVMSTAARRIALNPLSLDAVRRLTGNRTLDIDVLHEQTSGNPFFVTEVLASDQGGIPATVRDAVLSRAARLSLSGRAVLNAAAVIGTHIEPWLLAEVTQAEAGSLDENLVVGILLARGTNLVFRHELARQTILDALPPHKRVFLHQAVLDALKGSPSTQKDVIRLAHHAEAAGDRGAVLAYAPAAAEQARIARAHREAAALYALTLRYAEELPLDEHARLLETYAQECDLVGQQAEGIAARRKAADLWRAFGNPLKRGENLAYLMSMLTRVGQNFEAERVIQASIKILEALPPGPELAMAYRVQAHQCLVNRDYEEALTWADKSLNLAERFQDPEVLAAVYVTVGTALLFVDYERGCDYLEEKLVFAHDAGLDVRVAHIYSNLGSASGELFQFQRAEDYLKTGIAFATERDLDSHRLYMMAWQSLIALYQGGWQFAGEMATAVLKSPGVNVIIRITALIALGRLRLRRGDPGVDAALDEALELATKTTTVQRLGPAYAARAEAAWLAGDKQRTLAEARAVYDLAVSKRHPWFTGELAYWRWRAGDEVTLPAWTAVPFARHIVGDWQGAAEAWGELGCPYEQARALTDGDSEAQIAALNIFEQLGAQPMAEAVRQKLKAAGVQTIPRGPRTTTRDNPFNLTNRQLEILDLLTESLTNAEIAARLHISPKTVDHHVSAVLAKLDVHSREEAAELARQHPDL